MANNYFKDKNRDKNLISSFVEGVENTRETIGEVEVVVDKAISHIVDIPGLVNDISVGGGGTSAGGSSFSFQGRLISPLPSDLGYIRPPLIAFSITPKPENLPGIAWQMIKDKVKYWKIAFKNASTDISNAGKGLIDTIILLKGNMFGCTQSQQDQAGSCSTEGTLDLLIKSPVKTIKETLQVIISTEIPLLPCVQELDKELHAMSSLLSILKVVLNLLKKITGVIKLLFKLPSPLFVVKFILNICGEIANAIADQFDKDSETATGVNPNSSMQGEAAVAQYTAAQTDLPPKVKGTGQYYGSGPAGKVGYYNLPAGDTDLMKKSEYDPDRNGIVTECEWVADGKVNTGTFNNKLGPQHNTLQKCLNALDDA